MLSIETSGVVVKKWGSIVKLWCNTKRRLIEIWDLSVLCSIEFIWLNLMNYVWLESIVWNWMVMWWSCDFFFDIKLLWFMCWNGCESTVNIIDGLCVRSIGSVYRFCFVSEWFYMIIWEWRMSNLWMQFVKRNSIVAMVCYWEKSIGLTVRSIVPRLSACAVVKTIRDCDSVLCRELYVRKIIISAINWNNDEQNVRIKEFW